MKRFLLPLVLLTLAACSQAPTPKAVGLPNLAPMTFGTSWYDEVTGLAGHGSGTYAAGVTEGALHSPNQGYRDAFLRKYDIYGHVLWGRQFGTPGHDHPRNVASDYDNNAYVIGATDASLAGSKGQWDPFIRKYTSSGDIAWTDQFGTSSVDWATSVAIYDTFVYVVGYTMGDLAGSKGRQDAFIRQYDADGSVVWTKQFGTSADDFAYDLAVDESGNIYVVGTTYGSLRGANGGGGDMFIRKYSPMGYVLWTRQLHYSNRDNGAAVAVSGSHVYLIGNFLYNNNSNDTDVRVIKYTSGGTKVWDYGYGPSGHDEVYDASADSGGNIYFAGQTASSFGGTNQGGNDGYVIKLNKYGSRIWGKQIGTAGGERTPAVLAYKYYSGWYSLPSYQIYAAGVTNADAYVQRLSPSTGNTIWSR